MDIAYQYPPELTQLLIDTIPRLSRSKRDVLLFFRGAGVSENALVGLRQRVDARDTGLSKFEICRTVLAHVNEKGEAGLRERREILKRVVEFEDFSTCWPEDQLKARGLVSEIRRVINVKDSFARMNQEREREASARRDSMLTKQRRQEEDRALRQRAANLFFAAFAERDPSRRGTLAETALNAVFTAHGMAVREAFRVTADDTGVTLEQIDGVVELDGHLYMVEVKFLSVPIDVKDLSRHLVRVYHRGQARALFFSATEFTAAALAMCKEALQHTVIALCMLDELVRTLETHEDLREMLRRKIVAAQTDREPYVRAGGA